ncbi:MAG: hypothetical protein PHX51_07980 [Clostridia bacterium]|nr:hypothetical protein [Clostridia bacterium]
MRKMTLIIALFLLAVLTLSACNTLEDIAPTSYGEWEGNYIYKGNSRSKTTGEDYEILVTSIDINGDSIQATDTDCRYVGDDVYMCMAYGESGSSLIKYNIADKNAETLFVGDDTFISCGIRYLFDDFIVLLCPQIVNERRWFAIDYDGNIIDEGGIIGQTQFFNDYVVRQNGTNLEYKAWGETAYKAFSCDYERSIRTYPISQSNGRFYIRNFFFVQNENEYNTVNTGMSVYDIETGNTATLLQASATQNLNMIGGNHFILSKPQLFVYGGDLPGYAWMNYNCVLYKINSDLTTEEVFVFDENKDFTKYAIVDGYVNFTATNLAVKDSIFRKEGETLYEKYYLNLDSYKLSRGTYSSASSVDIDADSHYCGDYCYYIDTKSIGMWSMEYYYLVRKNTITDLTETMQFSGGKYCIEMFGHPYFDFDAIRSY